MRAAAITAVTRMGAADRALAKHLAAEVAPLLEDAMPAVRTEDRKFAVSPFEATWSDRSVPFHYLERRRSVDMWPASIPS